MDRLGKQKFLESFNKQFQENSFVIVLRHSKLSAGDLSSFRKNVKGSGAVFQVVKNSLVKKVLKDKSSALSEAFHGPIGIVIGSEVVGPAKVVADFCKKREDQIQIVIGCLDGMILPKEDVLRLSALPSLDEIRAQILRVLQAPASRLVRVFSEPAASLARVVDAKVRAQ